MEVLTYLESKLRVLRRYRDASRAFVEALERDESWRISYFEARRDAILKAYEIFHKRAEEAAARVRAEQRTPELVARVKELLDEQTRLLTEVTRLDERILRLVQVEHDRLRGQVQSSRKGLNAIGKFKSEWAGRSGEGLDTTL